MRPIKPAKYLLFAGGLWLGILFTYCTVFFFSDILALVIPQKKKIILLSVFPAGGIIMLAGFLQWLRGPQVNKHHLQLKAWPEKLTGFRIIQLSDLHINATTGYKQLRRTVDRINSQKADLIVITGDLLDQDNLKLGGYAKILKQLQSKYGVFAITGNHEHYHGVDRMRSFCTLCGVRLLHDEKTRIAGLFDLIGMDDIDIHESNDGKTYTPGQMLTQVGVRPPAILLRHRPFYFKEAARAGVSLQLSGHTHSGQILPISLAIRLLFRYPYGHHRFWGSDLYVSSGTGSWAVPFRQFKRSEITIFDISPANK